MSHSGLEDGGMPSFLFSGIRLSRIEGLGHMAAVLAKTAAWITLHRVLFYLKIEMLYFSHCKTTS
jgi:hypothetical protein